MDIAKEHKKDARVLVSKYRPKSQKRERENVRIISHGIENL